METRSAQLDLAHNVGSPRAARRFVATLLRGWGVPQHTVERTQLLVSELVSNAVLHGNGPVRLTASEIDARGSAFRIEVFNTGHGRPRKMRPSSDDLSGRGLQLVDELAHEWGTSSENGETRVWFDLHAEMMR